jgi:hypothetical protein
VCGILAALEQEEINFEHFGVMFGDEISTSTSTLERSMQSRHSLEIDACGCYGLPRNRIVEALLL